MSLFRRKPMDPVLQGVYAKTYAAEMRKIETQRQSSITRAVEAKARADAARASQTTGSRVLDGLMSAGKAINKRLDNFDQDKFEAFVTGKKRKG